MAGTVRYVPLETRTARMRLKPGRPYWRTLALNQLTLGYLRRRPGQPGRWIVRTYRGNEKYFQATLATADDYGDADGRAVLNFEQASAAARASCSATSGAPVSVVTVADAIEQYISWLRIHRRTADDAERRAAKLILPALGRVRLADLTAPMLASWRDELAASPALKRTAPGRPQQFKAAAVTAEERRKRRSSVNRVWTILRAALALAFRDGHVASDTAWRRIKPLGKADAARTGWLNIEEGKRLIAAAEGDFRDLITGALMTGMRYGEMRALRVGDFVHQKIHVKESKSGKPRDIVLNRSAIDFFEKLTAGRNLNDFMFLRNGKPWKPSEQIRPMREICEKAEIISPISFHGLRHAYCANSIMAGMSMVALAENVGHASITMLERHYKHLSAEYLDDKIKATAPVWD